LFDLFYLFIYYSDKMTALLFCFIHVSVIFALIVHLLYFINLVGYPLARCAAHLLAYPLARCAAHLLAYPLVRCAANSPKAHLLVYPRLFTQTTVFL
jgi:hypothetical protein